MSLINRAKQCGTFASVWHLFDAKWQDPFICAPVLAKYLKGLHKPIYHPMNYCGDHVVVINSKDIALKGEEWVKRVYFHHNTYKQGATWTLAWELHRKNYTMILRKAVYSALKSNLQRRHIMEHLHIYPDDNIPNEIMENISNQIRQIQLPPVQLDEISQEQIENFPRVIKFPENYVLK